MSSSCPANAGHIGTLHQQKKNVVNKGLGINIYGYQSLFFFKEQGVQRFGNSAIRVAFGKAPRATRHKAFPIYVLRLTILEE